MLVEAHGGAVVSDVDAVDMTEVALAGSLSRGGARRNGDACEPCSQDWVWVEVVIGCCLDPAFETGERASEGTRVVPCITEVAHRDVVGLPFGIRAPEALPLRRLFALSRHGQVGPPSLVRVVKRHVSHLVSQDAGKLCFRAEVRQRSARDGNPSTGKGMGAHGIRVEDGEVPGQGRPLRMTSDPLAHCRDVLGQIVVFVFALAIAEPPRVEELSESDFGLREGRGFGDVRWFAVARSTADERETGEDPSAVHFVLFTDRMSSTVACWASSRVSVSTSTCWTCWERISDRSFSSPVATRSRANISPSWISRARS